MKIYSFYGKTVKELVDFYKEKGYKYSSYKSKQELLNGLIIRCAFTEFKKAHITRLKDELSNFRSGNNLEDIIEPTLNLESTGIEEEYLEEGVEESVEEEEDIDVIEPESKLIEPLINKLKKDNPNDTFNLVLHDNDYKNTIYKYHKDYIMREYGSLGSHEEIYLFHGADEKNIKSILDNDFSLNGTGVHATAFGKGIYFTNRLEYACKYSTDNPRKKFILIVKVHVGDVVRGNQSLIRLPTMDSGKQYDTAVNSTNNPHIFVKFKNQHYTIVGCLEITLGEHSTLRGSRGVRVKFGTSSRTGSMSIGSRAGSPHIGSHVTQPYTISSSHKTSQSLVDIHHNYTNVPKFNKGDKVVLKDHKDLVYTIDDSTKMGGNHMYSIKVSHSDDKLSVKENKLFLWKNPTETWSSYYSRGGTSYVVATTSNQLNKTSMSVNNLTKESISLYFVPEGKCVYKNSLSDFKLMNYISPGESKEFHTKIDDAFVCANRECIIKYFKISKEKEKIEVQL